MAKPTKEQYEQAKEDNKTFYHWLLLSRKKKNELIDALITERKNELLYLEQLEKTKEIIDRYTVYEQVEKEGIKYEED